MDEQFEDLCSTKIRLSLFGAVRAWLHSASADVDVLLGPTQQRAVLAVLALAGGTPVPRDRIVDALWGGEPPRSAANAVQTYIKGLRQALEPQRAAREPSSIIPKVGDAYALRLPEAAVDLWRFRGAFTAARSARADRDTARVWRWTSAALELWATPVSDIAQLADHAEITALAEQRRVVVAWHIESAIAMGRAADVVECAEAVVAERPLDESARARLIEVFKAVGRRGDAFAAYREARRRLAEELGVNPGIELESAHQALLEDDRRAGADPARRDPGTRPAPVATRPAAPREVPAQLPAEAGHFTGRKAELESLKQFTAEQHSDPHAVVITGAGGMGKTALALHWAYAAARGFPDGQIFIDLHGHDPDAELADDEVLAQALRALDVPTSGIPEGTAEKASRYRSLISRRRVLIVLDNARSSAQVIHLVPPTSASYLVITSRNALPGLAVRHAVRIVKVDALSTPDSIELLRKCVGAQRLEAERRSVDTLVGHCAGMPLALRLAAAQLAANSAQSIAGLVADLEAEAGSLSALDVEDSPHRLRSVFSSVYRTLTPAAARMFRLLSLHPAPSFTVHLCAAVAAVPVAQARAALAQLQSVHLVTSVQLDRYQFHDLTRYYATERALADETEESRAAAVDRILEWYQAIVYPVNRITSPHRLQVRGPGGPEYELPFAPDDDLQAVAFLDQERDNLGAVVQCAISARCYDTAWQLAYQLFGYFLRRGHGQEGLELSRHGLTAAKFLGKPLAEAAMRHDIAVRYRVLRRSEEALHQSLLSIARAEEAGDHLVRTGALNLTGLCLADLRRYDEALEFLDRALTLASAHRDELGIGMTLNNLGAVFRYSGDAEQGLAYYSKALANRRATGHRYGLLISLSGTGEIHLSQGRYHLALDCFREAVKLAAELGDRPKEAEALSRLARAHLGIGMVDEAVAYWIDALRIYRGAGEEHGEAVTLAYLGRAALSKHESTAAVRLLRGSAALRIRVPDQPECARLHHAFGDLAAALGSPADAVHHWRLAVELLIQTGTEQDARIIADYLLTRPASEADTRPPEPDANADMDSDIWMAMWGAGEDESESAPVYEGNTGACPACGTAHGIAEP